MEITTYSQETIKVVNLDGEMNAVTSAEVETRLTQLILGGNRKLIINLSAVDYISSAGLRVFLAANKQMKKMQGEMRICQMNPTVKEVFEISGFHLIFHLYAELNQALDGF